MFQTFQGRNRQNVRETLSTVRETINRIKFESFKCPIHNKIIIIHLNIESIKNLCGSMFPISNEDPIFRKLFSSKYFHSIKTFKTSNRILFSTELLKYIFKKSKNTAGPLERECVPPLFRRVTKF